MPRLPRLSAWKILLSPGAKAPRLRMASPVGGFTFTTSAPRSARFTPQNGPAKIFETSNT